MKYYLVTVDYENLLRSYKDIDVEKHMIGPTYELMSFFELYNIPVTFFCNAPEINKFLKSNHKDSSKILKQLSDIVDRGHDIQMHFHPQWINFEWNKYTEEWEDNSNIDFWKHTISLEEYEADFKEGLSLLRDFSDKIVAYRGGGYLIEPVERNMPFLKKVGLHIDSSVTDTIVERYRGAEKIKELNENNIPPYVFDVSGIKEVPICSINGIRWDMSGDVKNVKILKQMRSTFSDVEEDCYFVMMGHNKQEILYEEIRKSLGEVTFLNNEKFIKFSEIDD
jgi:hypothetical protein